MNDTIAAISTALGIGAISIVRVSGPDAIKIVNSLTESHKLHLYETHTINYDHIMDGNKKIDEVLISVMKAPKTFTCEDVIEINAHGGIITTNNILKLLLKNGCRLAEPGEFTKRAFLNGRLDLTQAEAVSDLINSNSEKSRDLALNQLNGFVSNLIKDLRQDILEILANIEVNIDYPEYEDIEVVTQTILKPKIVILEKKMKKILDSSNESLIIKEGIKTSIIGKPNVGKSSILNCLLKEEKAIVTSIAGTTRDVVEGTILLNGVVFKILDTAGIRDTKNTVEKIGVNKSLELINQSDLILFVLNNNDKITPKEEKILKVLSNKKHIVVVNKIDLKKNLELPKEVSNVIEVSAMDPISIDRIKEKMINMFNLEEFELNDATYLTNARSIALLEDAYSKITILRNSLNEDIMIDMIEIDIKEIWNKLGEIIGETYQEELIDQLFSQFCLGK